MEIRTIIRRSSEIYIVAYESIRAVYVFVLMPLVGETFGSIVGAMMVAFAIMLIATFVRIKRQALGVALIYAYLIVVSGVWYCYALPTWSSYFRDRFLDFLLVAAFHGAGLGSFARSDSPDQGQRSPPPPRPA